MGEYVTIFQDLGFPIAICAFLGYFLWLIVRHNLKHSDETIKQIQAMQERQIDALQQQNAKLATIISDNTKALAENSKIFNELFNLLKAK